MSVLPTITGADHTHPRSLALLKQLLKDSNPAVNVMTDAATVQAVEQFRKFFAVTGDPAGRVGPNMWRALLKAATGGAK